MQHLSSHDREGGDANEVPWEVQLRLFPAHFFREACGIIYNAFTDVVLMRPVFLFGFQYVDQLYGAVDT